MSWQETLYPLGILSSLFFTARVLYQWYVAEKTRSSPAPRGFWILSVCGHFCHLVHSVIQMQLPIALMQGSNFVIAQRNLQMLDKGKGQKSLVRPVWHFGAVLLGTLLIFLLVCQGTGRWEWMRAPTFRSAQPVFLQLVGLIGIALSGSRFWAQWIATERNGASHFGMMFWVLSLTGALLSTIYFMAIWDWINLLSTVFTLIPYARNIFFLRKRQYG